MTGEHPNSDAALLDPDYYQAFVPARRPRSAANRLQKDGLDTGSGGARPDGGRALLIRQH